jgi:hypothetical protein
MTTPHTDAETVEEAAPTMRTFRTDLARFSTTGHGTIKGDVAALSVGDRVAVTDDEADTLEAEVVAVSTDSADVRIHWDRILHRA